MMLALTLVFSCSNQEVSLQTISTEENNPYKWDESFHVNSSTRASESPNEAYEFVPDGLTSGDYPGPFQNFPIAVLFQNFPIAVLFRTA